MIFVLTVCKWDVGLFGFYFHTIFDNVFLKFIISSFVKLEVTFISQSSIILINWSVFLVPFSVISTIFFRLFSGFSFLIHTLHSFLKKPVSGLQYWAFTFSNYDTDLYCYMNFSDKGQDNEDEYIDAVITFKKNSKYLKVKLTDEDGEPYKVRKGYYAELGLGVSGQYLNVGTGSKRFLIK